MKVRRIEVDQHTTIHQFNAHYIRKNEVVLEENPTFYFSEKSASKVVELEPFEIEDDRIKEIQRINKSIFDGLKEKIDQIREEHML